MLKTIVFGKGERLKVCLCEMIENGYVPEAILIEDEEDAELLETCTKYRINTLKSAEEIRLYSPDLLVLISYTKIIKEPLISLPKFGTINLHGGPLPEYRGASVLNWQIINGEKTGGISIISVDEGIDTGDILAQKTFPIELSDTFTEVDIKVLQLFPPLLVEVLDGITSKSLNPIKQNPNEGTYYHKRKPEDGHIDWKGMTANEVHNLVRALAPPCPGAFSFLNKKKLVVWKTQLLNTEFKGVPGRLVRVVNDGVVVIAKDKGILLTEIEDETGRRQAADLLKARCGASFGF